MSKAEWNMDIQWVIIAREIRTNPDTTMCIDGIFHHLNTYVFPDGKVDLLLIAKVKIDVTEAGDAKEIAVVIEHIKEGLVWMGTASYKVRDIVKVLNEKPYITLPLRNLELPYSGEYTFKLFVDKEYKNEGINHCRH